MATVLLSSVELLNKQTLGGDDVTQMRPQQQNNKRYLEEAWHFINATISEKDMVGCHVAFFAFAVYSSSNNNTTHNDNCNKQLTFS